MTILLFVGSLALYLFVMAAVIWGFSQMADVLIGAVAVLGTALIWVGAAVAHLPWWQMMGLAVLVGVLVPLGTMPLWPISRAFKHHILMPQQEDVAAFRVLLVNAMLRRHDERLRRLEGQLLGLARQDGELTVQMRGSTAAPGPRESS